MEKLRENWKITKNEFWEREGFEKREKLREGENMDRKRGESEQLFTKSENHSQIFPSNLKKTFKKHKRKL